MKKFFFGLCLLAVVAIIAILVAALPGRDTLVNPVVGLPSDYDVTPASLPSYAGLHPSQVDRPEETYAFPIKTGEVGPVEPLYGGPLQYPFLCRTEESLLGQPEVDNQDGVGMPVYVERNGEKTDQIAGYSKDCSLKTKVQYLYNRVGSDSFFPLSEAKDDIATVVVNGEEIDFVVRVETGTINRFIYTLVVLRGKGETLASPVGTYWNKRLIYQFRGGVGIGRRQGRIEPSHIPRRRLAEIAKGYAVAYSSGNQTSNHYDALLAEDTVVRVKRQFEARYGKPDYVVGIGGSGGAIQQYLIAQNNPGVLDALIPLYSYPDMVTQISYGLDCELLEHYFDVTDKANPRWRKWSNRSLVQGLNARDDLPNTFSNVLAASALLNFRWPAMGQGLTECVNGWRGAAPLVNNPRYAHFLDRFVETIHPQVNWTYWDNLSHVYGTDSNGYGRSTFDNHGVQYGLQALKQGELTTEEFLHLNRRIGSWKSPANMEDERYWRRTGARSNLADISPWSHQNMRLSTKDEPAPRQQGHRDAMQAAILHGQVFLGLVNVPIVDLRHYLEDELDMHHVIASFSSRKRIQQAGHDARQQLIWVAHKNHNAIPHALEVLDQWLQNLKANPTATVGDARPEDAQDTCFDEKGEVIAAGIDVWNGDWNQREPGACSRIYPSFSTSRMVAGEDVAGNLFKCSLQPVEQAIAAGVYGSIPMEHHVETLKTIFPDGVCDYSKDSLAQRIVKQLID